MDTDNANCNNNTDLEFREVRITYEDFKTFVEECKRWQHKLHLHAWRLDFIWMGEEDTEFIARCNTLPRDRVATITLGSSLGYAQPQQARELLLNTAKHEMLELLLGKLYQAASNRFTTQREIDEACHEAIRTLECIVPDLED
jgi:hypothetical protein